VYYDALVVHDMYGLKQLIRKDDTVLLQSGPGEQPYICLVHEVWREPKTGESYLKGVWFYRHEDLPEGLLFPSLKPSPPNNAAEKKQSSSKQNSTKDEQVKEIFLSTEKFVNSAETILAKAVVMYATDTEEQRKWKSSLLVGIEEERDEVIATYNVVLPDIVSNYRCNYNFKARVSDLRKKVRCEQ